MYKDLLKIKLWNAETNNNFFHRIRDFSNDEKCTFAVDVAEKLMKRGDNSNIVSAEVILVHATEHYFENVSSAESKAKVYYSLGKLYETHLEDYAKAYTAYEKYTLNTGNDCTHSLLMKALILRDGFVYSEQLEKEYRYSLGEVDLGLRNDRFYEALASYIINTHYEKDEEAEKMKKRLQGILKGDKFFFLDIVTKKDNIPDTLKIPQNVIDFVNSL